MIIFSNPQKKEQEEHIKKALLFFMEHYLKKNVDFVVQWKVLPNKELAFVALTNDCSRFEIFINPSDSIDSLLLSISHEIVHVKQMIDNRLSIPLFGNSFAGAVNPLIRWQSSPDVDAQFILHKERKYMSEKEWESFYFNLPWEIEAYREMHTLYDEYVEYFKKELNRTFFYRFFKRFWNVFFPCIEKAKAL